MNLYPHQTEALEATRKFNRVAYYMDMGLGKTFVGSEKLVSFDSFVNLIVCQKSKINDWIEHIKNHYEDCGVYDLTKKNEYDLFFQYMTYKHEYTPTLIGVINYDLAFRRKDLLNLKDFTLLLDESSVIQNDTAKRSKFILSMHPENVILLSGTPTSGKYENLWSQIHLLGWSISKELYNTQYVNWETIVVDDIPHKRVNPENPYKNVDRLKDKLRSYGAYFKKTDECFELPEQVFVTTHIKAIPEYRRFRKKKLVTINGIELVGDSTLTERLYSRMLCGHYNHNKLEAFVDLLNSTKERIIVFYNFNAELDILKSLTKDLNRPISEVNGSIKDLTAYENFNDSVTFVQYQAGAMGLNLQKSRHIVYFTLTDKTDLFEQSKKRIHRIGQDRTCFYHLLLCENTVDESILETLNLRRDYTDELFSEERR